MRRLRASVSAPTWVVVGGALGLTLLHLRWLERFRWGYLTDYDEASYVAIPLHIHHRVADALSSAGGVHDPIVGMVPVIALGAGARGLLGLLGLGIAGFLTYRLTSSLMPQRWAVVTSAAVGAGVVVAAALPGTGQQAPLVLVSAVPLLTVFGATVDVAQVTVLPYFFLLVLASYGLARRLMPPWWAALAAICVGTAPVVTDYSRLFHFGVPAAALLTAAVYALVKSNGLRDTRWVVTAGVLLGLTLLARTMTIAYMPGVALGVAVPLLVHPNERRRRWLNLVLLGVIALAVAATWYVPNLGRVGSYLASSGYGSESALYGEQHSIASVAYWTKQAKLVANYLYLPLLATLVVCLVAGAVSGRRRLRRLVASPAFLPLAVVVFGYLVLSTTSNQGTAFSLPWLPSLIVLAVGGGARIGARPLRIGLAALLVAVCAFDLTTKSGIGGLSEPASAEVPVLDRVTVLDGRDLIYAQLDRYGYPVDPPPEELPPLHRRWGGFHREVVRRFWPLTGGRGVKPHVDVGTGDWLLSSTRLQLASELEYHARITARPARLGGADTVQAYRQRLLEDGANVLLTSDPARVPVTTISRAKLEAAARQLGFVRIGRVRVPDGRRAWVWVGRLPAPAPRGSPPQSG